MSLTGSFKVLDDYVNVKNRLLTIDGTKVRKLIKSKNFKKLSKFINQDLLKYLSKKA